MAEDDTALLRRGVVLVLQPPPDDHNDAESCYVVRTHNCSTRGAAMPCHASCGLFTGGNSGGRCHWAAGSDLEQHAMPGAGRGTMASGTAGAGLGAGAFFAAWAFV
jgi:hypothetical protein